MKYQLPLKPFSYAFPDMTNQENDFVNYFLSIRSENITPVVEKFYPGVGPRGYGSSLILSRILKVKELFMSDRDLVDKLAKNELYRFVCGFSKNSIPAHNTYHTLRKNLGVWGYIEIHSNFVRQANSLGLLDPEIPELPKNRRKGVILIADSTFIYPYASTKGEKQEDGTWKFSDLSLAFGRPHHKYRYSVGHRAHSLMTISGIPTVSIVAANNIHDQYYIIPLLDEFRRRFPDIKVAYVVLDKGYDSEPIYKIIYESYHIIPVIIRKKMVYPKGFTKDGFPLCDFRYSLKKKSIDYHHERTKYTCEKICLDDPQKFLFKCPYLEAKSPNGLIRYTYFKDSYRKFGPALPNTIIYRKLKPYRTAIERNFGLVKENRYRLEVTNTYKGFENVLWHVIDHDITLTQDVIFNFQRAGKVSSVIKT